MNFIDRRTGSDTLLIILAGYKQQLYNVVFDRLIDSDIEGIDVCIVSSGVHDAKLEGIAAKHGFSYFYSDLNNICWCENKVIEIFDTAKYIFKMDEDIFVTKNTFKRLLNDFIITSKMSHFVPSSVVPLINVNCTTYRTVLERAGKLDEYEKKFGKAVITNGLHHHKHVLENPEIAKFIWKSVDIDKYQTGFFNECIPCPTRFSIGLILFTREVWEMMEHFTVELDAEEDYRRKGLGTDEKDLCKFAMMKAMPMMISPNVLVGHLGYGPQTPAMLQFFEQNRKYFVKKI